MPPGPAQTARAHRAAGGIWGQPAGDGYAYLQKITQPALVVNGRNDIVLATVNSFILQQNLPDAQLILYPDSGQIRPFIPQEKTMTLALLSATPQAATIPASGPGTPFPRLSFHQVPEPKTVKNRLHLDLITSQTEAETSRLLGLGATHLRVFEQDGRHRWTIFADP